MECAPPGGRAGGAVAASPGRRTRAAGQRASREAPAACHHSPSHLVTRDSCKRSSAAHPRHSGASDVTAFDDDQYAFRCDAASSAPWVAACSYRACSGTPHGLATIQSGCWTQAGSASWALGMVSGGAAARQLQQPHCCFRSSTQSCMLGILRCTIERSISCWHPSSVGDRNALAISEGGNLLHATLHDITLVRTTTSVQCMTHGYLYPRSMHLKASERSIRNENAKSSRPLRIPVVYRSVHAGGQWVVCGSLGAVPGDAAFAGGGAGPGSVHPRPIGRPAERLHGASRLCWAVQLATDKLSRRFTDHCAARYIYCQKHPGGTSRHLHLATNNSKAAF